MNLVLDLHALQFPCMNIRCVYMRCRDGERELHKSSYFPFDHQSSGPVRRASGQWWEGHLHGVAVVDFHNGSKYEGEYIRIMAGLSINILSNANVCFFRTLRGMILIFNYSPSLSLSRTECRRLGSRRAQWARRANDRHRGCICGKLGK